jgi:hypothetical protein
MRPWDAPALLRPPFAPVQFTPTKWDTAEDKAVFANALARFIASDFRPLLFTEKLYARLHNCFGHIACHDRSGFIAQFFESISGKIDFLEQTISHPCYGDPNFTYSDVEKAMIRRLPACGILDFYRAVQAAETEAHERRLLAALRAKYEAAPTAPDRIGSPIVPPPSPAMPRGFLTPLPASSAAPSRRPASADARQPSLL